MYMQTCPKCRQETCAHPVSLQRTILSAADKQMKRQRFEGVFSKIVDELLDHMKSQNMPEAAINWYRQNLEYNTPGGKLNRGLSVVDTVDILLCFNDANERTRELTDTEYFEAALLGWCVELVRGG